VTYRSVCSGIEAATVAWEPLGWRALSFSEIEPFPCSVLAHRFPGVPNLGDMTRFAEWSDDDPTDVLVGGTPCQSFSVAGLRKGLADPRGNLALVYLAIAERFRPRWVVWENVPGVLSSNGGRDFGAFLGALGQLGYGYAYRTLDAQFFGVPQRRRRVFVVGYLGDWRRAAAVLFERDSMQGNPANGRAKGKAVAALTANGVGTCGAVDNQGQAGHLVASTGRISHCLNAGGMGRQDYETETLIAHSLRGEGFDASEDGTGRGTPLVPVYQCHGSNVGEMGTLRTGNGALTGGVPFMPVAFDTTQITSQANRSNPKPGDPCHPLARGAHPPAIAIQERAVSENLDNGPGGKGFREGVAYTLEARHHVQAVQHQHAVRRLTPRECERLQGFPDDWTLVPHRGKPAADGPRYKAIGNSMAVPVMAWIGRRIQLIETIPRRSLNHVADPFDAR
jgi:DNA (cytosine-5)-methyltransferase 1